jgi:hypothetical protein
MNISIAIFIAAALAEKILYYVIDYKLNEN